MKHTFCMSILISAMAAGCYADIRIPPDAVPKKKIKASKVDTGKQQGSGLVESTEEVKDNNKEKSESLINDVPIIEVSNFRFSGGQVCYSVFDSEEGFPKSAELAVTAGCKAMPDCNDSCTTFKLRIEIPELDYGRDYAVALFHDLDNDGALKAVGPLEIPGEDFAFSNTPDVFSKFGAPDYEECMVTWSEETPVAELKLQNIL